MTTSRKLWLGFGTLIGLLLVTGMTIFLSLLSHQRDLSRITAIEEPVAFAAYEMQKNVVDMGLGIMKYMDTGQKEYRHRIQEDAAAFNRSKGVYQRLATSPGTSERVHQLETLYASYRQTGMALMDHWDRQEATFEELGRGLEAIEELLDPKIQSNNEKRGAAGLRNAAATLRLARHVRGVAMWLGHSRWTRDPEYRDRIFASVKQFEADLARFRESSLSASEKEWADELDSRFNDVIARVRMAVAVDETRHQEASQFQELRAELDKILDNSIRVIARRYLNSAHTSAHYTLQIISTTTLALMIVGVSLGVATAVTASRAIISFERALQKQKDQLRQQAVELEQRVGERTRDLQQANDQLETVVFSIAHDLRAPLRAMQGCSSMLIEDHGSKLDESALEYAQRIRTSAEFMDRLLLGLLEYGRTDRTELEMGPVSLEAAWTSAVFQCQHVITQKQATIESVLPLPSVHAHEATLGQILANLLSNALKFTAPAVQPTVRFWAEERSNAVRMWVEDRGIGIALDHQHRIFRIFERLHGSAYGGTGLGLSIVQKGVQRMGGTIGVESNPGGGSRFWVELPKAKPQPPLQAQA